MRKTTHISTALLLLVLPCAAPAQEGSSNSRTSGKALMVLNGNSGKDVGYPVSPAPNYVIGPQDLLDISVWKEPDLSRALPVRPDGKISLPLLNDVQAGGLTPTQLAGQIENSLKKYVTDPKVTVIVTAINSQRIYILGEVARPGAYSLLPGMTLLQGLANGGAFSRFADIKNIYLLRQENEKQRRYAFNYKDVINGKKLEQNIVLKAGDTIVVP